MRTFPRSQKDELKFTIIERVEGRVLDVLGRKLCLGRIRDHVWRAQKYNFSYLKEIAQANPLMVEAFEAVYYELYPVYEYKEESKPGDQG